MKINFKRYKPTVLEGLNHGKGSVSSKMFMNDSGKIMISTLPKGASIGKHVQKTSDDINYIISGEAEAECNGVKERLSAGDCHYAPKGSVHSIENVGDEDLVMFTVVSEK